MTKFINLFALLLALGIGSGVRAAQSIDLSITYTDGVANFTPGGSLLYTAFVTNNDAVITATNVSVSATVPTVATFNSAQSGGVFANGAVKWTLASLAPGASTMLQFTIDVPQYVPAGTAHSMSSTATVTVDPAQGSDPTPANNSVTDTDALNIAPDMIICTIDHAQDCVFTNGTLTYVLTVCDIGNVGVTGIIVKDTIPPGTSFVSADNGGTFANGVVTFGPFARAPQVKLFLTIVVKVNAPLAAGMTTLTNSATVTDDGSNGADSDPSNNAKSVTDCVKPSVDMAVLKVVNVNNPNLGETVTYVVTATNNGPDNASNAVVKDPLPAGLVLVGAIQSAGLFDSNSGTWTIGAMNVGASATLTITCTVTGNSGGSIDNSACVSNPETDPNPANNCATVSILPSCAEKPQIVSGPTITPTLAVAGSPLTFTVGADNGGNQPLTVLWDFGDGSTGTGLSTQHTYASGGAYSVKVSVSNACGGSGTSASLVQNINPQPSIFTCTLLRAPLNSSRANADSLTMLAQLNVIASSPAAGKRIAIQINQMFYAVELDSSGRFKDSHANVSLKGLGSKTLLTFKLAKSSLRDGLMPGVSEQTSAATLKDSSFVIKIGDEFFSNKLDLHYTSKRNSGIIER